MHRCTILTLAWLAMSGATASAQPAAESTRYFVEGGITADRDPNTRQGEPTTVPAITAAVGASFSNQWSLRFEVTVPGWHESTVVDVIGPWMGVTSTITTLEKHRLPGLAFMAGRDFTAGPRVRVTPVGGFSSHAHNDRGDTLVVHRTTHQVLKSESYSYAQNEPRIALAAGADLPIDLTRRISVVPQFRLHYVLGDEWSPILRAGVALRAQF